MKREEVVENFKVNVIEPDLEKVITIFYHEFQTKKYVFVKRIYDEIEDFLKKIEKEEPETELATIRISYLQASIIDGSYQWQLCAQDKREYLDPIEREKYISLKEFFGCIEAFSDNWEKEEKKYVGNMYSGEVQKYKVDLFEKCIGCLTQCIIYALCNFRESESFEKQKKYVVFKILFGGYMDKMTPVFIHKETDMAEIKNFLRLPGEKKHLDDHTLIHNDLRGIQLKEVAARVEAKNFMFSTMLGGRIQYQIFMFCNMIGVCMRNMHIDDSGFVGCTFQLVDFTEANIENSDMHMSVFYGGEIVDGQVTPGIFGASFRNSNLHRVNFMECDLRNCDFTGANLSEIVWIGAKMSGVILERKYYDEMELSEQQRKDIVWIS